MDAEVVTFEGYRSCFELMPHPDQVGHTVVRLVYRDEPGAVTVAPGTPYELATLLRERTRCPDDVFKFMNELGMAQAG